MLCWIAARPFRVHADVSTLILSTIRSYRADRRAQRLRNLLAAFALIAVAWPSLGPLSFLVHDFGSHLNPASGHSDADDDKIDASSIPGSPTHPADHNCPECEILKHLSRCVLPTLAIAIGAPVAVAVVTQWVADVRPPAKVAAHLPPARAPPPTVG
jgi:hypothetical protein